MKTVAVILARGGSKGIPKKNLYKINGKPLLYYTMSAAIMSNVDEVWVSSDCKDILDYAEEFGVHTLRRPEELAQDHSTSESALLHFAEHVDFDKIVFIQPTSPLLKTEDINAGLAISNKKNSGKGEYYSVFSGYKEHWVPRWNLFGENKYLIPEGWNIYARPRRQDVKKKIIENGAFYITSRKKLLKSKNRYSHPATFYEMPYSRSFQVDTIDDLIIIESLLKNKNIWEY